MQYEMLKFHSKLVLSRHYSSVESVANGIAHILRFGCYGCVLGGMIVNNDFLLFDSAGPDS